MIPFTKSLIEKDANAARAWEEMSDYRIFAANRDNEITSGKTPFNNVDWVQQGWARIDEATVRIARDPSDPLYDDLMGIARSVDIGTMVHLSRASSDISDMVKRSLSGQKAVPVDKVQYSWSGTLVPIFDKGYAREWRELEGYRANSWDPIVDDQEAALQKLREGPEGVAAYFIDGDAEMVFKGVQGYGIRTNPASQAINIGPAGANIDLTTADFDAIDAFFTGAFGAVMDSNRVRDAVTLYVSPEIGRNMDKGYFNANGARDGTIGSQMRGNRRIADIKVSYRLEGNEFIAFPVLDRYIRPLVGLPVQTFAMPRQTPRDNYQFMVSTAVGLEIRGDYDGQSGVFYSVLA